MSHPSHRRHDDINQPSSSFNRPSKYGNSSNEMDLRTSVLSNPKPFSFNSRRPHHSGPIRHHAPNQRAESLPDLRDILKTRNNDIKESVSGFRIVNGVALRKTPRHRSADSGQIGESVEKAFDDETVDDRSGIKRSHDESEKREEDSGSVGANLGEEDRSEFGNGQDWSSPRKWRRIGVEIIDDGKLSREYVLSHRRNDDVDTNARDIIKVFETRIRRLSTSPIRRFSATNDEQVQQTTSAYRQDMTNDSTTEIEAIVVETNSQPHGLNHASQNVNAFVESAFLGLRRSNPALRNDNAFAPRGIISNSQSQDKTPTPQFNIPVTLGAYLFSSGSLFPTATPWWTPALLNELRNISGFVTNPATLLSARLHREITAFMDYIRPTLTENREINNLTKYYLNFLNGKVYDAEFFTSGSRFMGVYFPWDPIDIAVIIDYDNRYLLHNRHGHMHSMNPNYTRDQQTQIAIAMTNVIKKRLSWTGAKVVTAFWPKYEHGDPPPRIRSTISSGSSACARNLTESLTSSIADMTTRARVNVNLMYRMPNGNNMLLRPPNVEAKSQLLGHVDCEQLRVLTLLIRQIFSNVRCLKEVVVESGSLDGYSILLWVTAFLRVHPYLYGTDYVRKMDVLQGHWANGSTPPTIFGNLFFDFCHFFGKVFDYQKFGLNPNAMEWMQVIYERPGGSAGGVHQKTRDLNSFRQLGSSFRRELFQRKWTRFEDEHGQSSKSFPPTPPTPNNVYLKPLLMICDPVTARQIPIITKTEHVKIVSKCLCEIMDSLVEKSGFVDSADGNGFEFSNQNRHEFGFLLEGLVGLTRRELKICDLYRNGV
ncbi:hypothetical protein HDU76_001013, partial [Blyttiomyces sp. JEL0837]